MPGLMKAPTTRRTAAKGAFNRAPSSKSKTHSGACSAAASAWVLGRKSGSVSPGVYQVLAKCRAMAKGGNHAAKEGLEHGQKPEAVQRAKAVLGRFKGESAAPAKSTDPRDRLARMHRLAQKAEAAHVRLKAKGVTGDRYTGALDRSIRIKDRANAERDKRAVELKTLRKVRDAAPKRAERGTPDRLKAAERLHRVRNEVQRLKGEAAKASPAPKPAAPSARPTVAQIRHKEFQGKMSKAAAMKAHAARKAAEATKGKPAAPPTAVPARPTPAATRQKTAERLKTARTEDTAHPTRRPMGHLETSKIHFDPGRFQYKLEQTDTKTGSVGSLAGVKKFDPELAGVVQVWHDPANGKTFVVNGHNRLDLAKKLGVSKVAVRYIDAKDAGEARAKGALTNIAEGRGTAVDAAKFFRDTGIQKADLDRRGIPLTEAKANQGLALAGLAHPLFRRVIDQSLPVERATIIGGSGLSHEQQSKLVAHLDKQKGTVTNAHLKEMVDEVKAAPTRKAEGGGLFGHDDAEAESLFNHRTSLIAHIKERLGKEKRLFGTVAKSKAAATLERGGNTIDTERSGQISQQAGEALSVFDTLKRSKGPVGEVLHESTKKLASAKSAAERKRIHDEAYAGVLRRVREAYDLRK
jgi:hypothetical protein